jgi:uncharacterized membrane protein YhaH (DUF805 family)
MDLIGRHLTGLFRFSGREGRQPFWIWAAIVFAGMMVVWTAYFAVTIGRIEQFAGRHPDQVTRTIGPGSYSVQIQNGNPEAGALFSQSAGVMAIIAVAGIILLAAAAVRRLHDSGRSGWWGLPTPALLLLGLGVMSHLMAVMQVAAPDGEPPEGFFAWFGAMMLLNLTYLASLVLLIVLCCLPSQPHENRYGGQAWRGKR